METLYFILLLLSALSFLGAALGRGTVGDGRNALALVPVGLLFFVLVPLIQTGRAVF